MTPSIQLLVQGRVAARLHDTTGCGECIPRSRAVLSDSPVFLKWEAERSLARLFEDENQLDSADREYRTALDHLRNRPLRPQA